MGVRRRLRPRFDDPALEAAFVEQEDLAAQRRGRVALTCGLVLTPATAFVDPAVVPGDVGGLLVLRAVIFVLTAVLLVLYRPPYLRWFPVLSPAGFLLYAWGIAAMVPVGDAPLLYVSGGMTVSGMAAFAITGPRFSYAVPVGGLILAGFAAVVATSDADAGDRIASTVFVTGALGLGLTAAWLLEDLRRRQFLDARELAEERARSDRLLHAILPERIAARLRVDPAAFAEGADEVTVVFADVIGSTPLAERLEPTELVRLLDRLFCELDAVCRDHGAEKIKTIGDAYMAVVGLVRPDPHHADTAVAMAAGWLAVARRFEGWPGGLELRVGAHSGPVVAGVIGRDKPSYDLWGDTVNTASRMESHGAAGRIHLSEATARLLREPPAAEPLETEVRGKGRMRTYLLEPSGPPR